MKKKEFIEKWIQISFAGRSGLKFTKHRDEFLTDLNSIIKEERRLAVRDHEQKDQDYRSATGQYKEDDF